MKTALFPYRQIHTHKAKSLGFLITVILFFFLTVWLFFVYKNIIHALDYYVASSYVDPTRVEMTSWGNILTLFTDNDGINNNTLESIMSDTLLHDQESYVLVEYPLMAKFSLFSFALETDIPVFAYSGKTLTGTDIGISKKMLDYYNIQFAGSTAMFPMMNEAFLKWQKIQITVGASKLFNIDTAPTLPFEWTITSISPNYPGFWLVIPRAILEKKLSEIWQKLWNPYKVIAFMNHASDREKIEKKYKNLQLSFDVDKIQDLKNKILAVQMIFLAVFLLIGGIIFVLFLYLLTGIFSESTSIYRMIRIYGTGTLYTRMLTLGEPTILLAFGIIIGMVSAWWIEKLLMNSLRSFLENHGLLFQIESLWWGVLFFMAFMVFIVFFGILFLLDIVHVRKNH